MKTFLILWVLILSTFADETRDKKVRENVAVLFDGIKANPNKVPAVEKAVADLLIGFLDDIDTKKKELRVEKQKNLDQMMKANRVGIDAITKRLEEDDAQTVQRFILNTYSIHRMAKTAKVSLDLAVKVHAMKEDDEAMKLVEEVVWAGIDHIYLSEKGLRDDWMRLGEKLQAKVSPHGMENWFDVLKIGDEIIERIEKVGLNAEQEKKFGSYSKARKKMRATE